MKRAARMTLILMLALMTAVTTFPMEVSAASTKNKPKADSVEYYKDASGKKTGIKYITIKPYTYYNISRDPAINTKADGSAVAPTLELDYPTIERIAKTQIFPRWGVIAEGIFRDQANQLVTIEGSGMMSSDKGPANSFDRHFSKTRSGVSGHNYNWSLDDLASTLGNPPSKSGKAKSEQAEFSILKGETNWDEVVYSGVYGINNLSDARTLMGKSLRACADDDDLTVDDFLGNSKDKSDNKYRLPDISDDKTKSGYASIVTCVNRAGSSGDYDYVCFGLAAYDFDVTPLAASDMSYIHAAQEYSRTEDPIQAAAEADTTGATYSSNSQTVHYYLQNKSSQESSTGVSMTTEESEELSSTTEESFEWGMEQEIGMDWNIGGNGSSEWMFPAVTLHFQQNFHELWNTMKGNTETKAKQQSRSVSQEVVLPGHTAAQINQTSETSQATENYQQPFVLNYKIAVFAMSGDYYNGWGGLISDSRYDKEWMSVIFDGSDAFELNGCNALSSLYNRAVVNRDTDGYDKTKGRYRSWCDKSSFSYNSKINWSSIAQALAEDNRASHNIPNHNNRKSTLDDISNELLFAESARILNRDRKSMSSTVENLVPYYNLDSVDVVKGSKNYEMRKGEKLYLDSVELEGYDSDNVVFYGFDSKWGEWALSKADATGATETEVDGILRETTADKRLTLCTDQQTGSQWVEISSDQTTDSKSYHLKWKVDEDVKISTYTTMNDRATYPDGYMSSDELAAVETPMIGLNVKSDTADVGSITVSGTYKGAYDQPLNLNKELDVTVLKNDDKTLLNVPIYWEDNDSRMISVHESGDTEFSTPGTYKVRAYCLQDGVHINSNWIEITAGEKASLKKIDFAAPDYDADDLALTKKTQSLAFDLNSFVKYYDQFGEIWEGTEESPLPTVSFSVDDTEGAEIDENGILSISEPGTYRVTAAAEDANGNALSYVIPVVKLTISEERWLDTVELETPPVGKSDLMLRNVNDQIEIPNLKGLLSCYDQRGREWTGEAPKASFRILEKTSGAEIKSGGGYTFYAYEPGTYTIRATVPGYNVNDITVEITEDPRLVITTTDPPKMPINEKSESVIVDLDKYVGATTQFGGTWKDAPAMKYTLEQTTGDATIGAKTVTDGDTKYTIENAFICSTPGTYTVHVATKKASAYSDPIDDIEITVYKNRRVKTVMVNFYDMDMSERTLSEIWELDPADYLEYTDQFDETISKEDLENMDLPEIKGYEIDNDFDNPAMASIVKQDDGSFRVEVQTEGTFGICPVVEDEYTAYWSTVTLIDDSTAEKINKVFTSLADIYYSLCYTDDDAEAIYERACTEIFEANSEAQAKAAYNEAAAKLDKYMHNWGEVTYTWSDDLSTCTARRECANADHPETETAVAVETERVEPTLTYEGYVTFEAEFENKDFAKQTVTKVLPIDPEVINQAAANEVAEMIAGIPDEVSLDNMAVIEIANAAYQDLTDDQKALISEEALKKLEDAEGALAAIEAEAGDQEVADAVTGIMENIPESAGLQDKAVIKAARAAYDKLSDDQKALISEESVKKLEDAEGALAAAEKEAADKSAAKKAANAIAALPASPTVKDKAAVTAARKAYDALTDAQKALVSESTLKKLTDAEKAVKAAEKKAAEYAANGNAYVDTKLPKVKIKAPKKAKKSFTAKWKKLSAKQQKAVKGIEIEYSTKADFSKAYKFKKTGKKKVSLKVKSLKSGKTYYVRAHTYVIKNGVKYVSKWSAVKKVKVR